MAYKKNYSKSYNRNKKKSRFAPIEKFAYNMGLVNQQLAYDSRVSDSYNAGVLGPNNSKRKPLFGQR